MNKLLPARICLVPRLMGVGGMVSFQGKLAEGLISRGIKVHHDLSEGPFEAVLVIGGTRQLAGLWRAKRRGTRLVQRLDGMNWMHQVQPTGIRHRLRAEYGNLLLAFIRSRFADAVVYQSDFAREWWERVHGRTKTAHTTIHNGVNLDIFNPEGLGERPSDRIRLLLVEGSLMGGYELGLANALDLAVGIAERISSSHSQPNRVELMVAGRIEGDQQAYWDKKLAEKDRAGKVKITWSGVIPHPCIPEIDRSAHLLYSADLNPACPNAVIEAIACGTPVVAFRTGALLEIVTPEAGRIVPYGGDPWQLEKPDVPGLVEGAIEVLEDQRRFRAGARARAEAAFDLERMVDRYIKVLLDGKETEK
jgi:glycosyltransferase involved in cell wall biosynthesis